MRRSEEVLIKTLKEEYDKRLKYFVNEKINISDKRGNNLIKHAEGLKVRDKSGFEYTVAGYVKRDGEEFIKLYLPEFGREITGVGSSKLYEDEDSARGSRGFISKTLNGKREVSPISDFDPDDYESGPDKKYVLINVKEFSERFEI